MFEKLIKETAMKIADKVDSEEDKGQCTFIPYFLKYYLYRYHNIDIKIHHGLIEIDGKYSHHNWNTYEGKLIDISIHQQYESADSNCIILDDIYIDKGFSPKYHLEENLPSEYLNNIEKSIHLEKDISVSVNERFMCSKVLNADATMLKLVKIKLNDNKKNHNYLKNKHKEKFKAYLSFMK